MAETIFHSLFVGSDRADAGTRSASRTSHTGGAWVLPLQLFIVWTVVGLIFSFQMVVRGTSALALAFGIIGWWQWALITGLVARFDRALPFTDKQLGWRIAAHGALGTIVNCTYVLVNGEIGCLLGVNSWNPLTSLEQALDWLLWCWPIYALIVGGVFAFRYYKRYQSSELQRASWRHSPPSASCRWIRNRAVLGFIPALRTHLSDAIGEAWCVKGP